MTIDDMEDLLSRLGMEVVSTRGDEVQSYCPAHEERTGHKDRNPSFWINADSGAFICFSCQFKGGVNSLISYVQNIPFEEAATWFSSEEGLSKKFERLTKDSVFEEVTEIRPSMLAAFKQPTDEMLRGRGIIRPVAEEYGLLWDDRKDCWIIPIYDPISNELLGWQEKGVNSRYFNNYPKGVKKSVALFGYAQTNGTTAVVVESPLDCARLASVGISNGVATYGSMVSREQMSLLRGFELLYVAMDNDEAGIESSKKFLEASRTMGLECMFFNYGNSTCKDVGGMSKMEIIDGLENARHAVRGMKAIV